MCIHVFLINADDKLIAFLLSANSPRSVHVYRADGLTISRVLEYFTWIHQPVRVKGTLDASHDINSIRPEFFDKIFFFA